MKENQPQINTEQFTKIENPSMFKRVMAGVALSGMVIGGAHAMSNESAPKTQETPAVALANDEQPGAEIQIDFPDLTQASTEQTAEEQKSDEATEAITNREETNQSESGVVAGPTLQPETGVSPTDQAPEEEPVADQPSSEQQNPGVSENPTPEVEDETQPTTEETENEQETEEEQSEDTLEGQELADDMAEKLSNGETYEDVSFMYGSQFNVSEEYQQQYGIRTVYQPVRTGKDSIAYFQIDQETGQVTSGVIDTRHGVVTNGREDAQDVVVNISRTERTSSDQKGGEGTTYVITASDQENSFVGQTMPYTEPAEEESNKGGGDEGETQDSLEADQALVDEMAQQLNANRRYEDATYEFGAEFIVSDEYREATGVSKIYHPLRTGKGSVGYFTRDEEGNWVGNIINANYGVIECGERTCETRTVDIIVWESQDGSHQAISADDEQYTFVGQHSGYSKGGPTPNDSEYGQDPNKGGGETTS